MLSMNRISVAAILVALVIAPAAHATEGSEIDMDAFNQCLLDRIKTAGPDDTVAEIREACLLEVQGVEDAPDQSSPAGTPDGDTPLDDRLEGIKATQELEPALRPLHLREGQLRIQRQTVDHRRQP